MSSFNNIIRICQNLLNTFPGAEKTKKYINSRISEDSQNKFSFGYFPSRDNIGILLAEINKKELIDCNLLYQKTYYNTVDGNNVDNYLLCNHNLIMPYRNVYGEIIAIVGRTILNDKEREELNIPKYMNSTFTKGNHLFGLYEGKQEILKKDEVFVVEGQMDVIGAHNKDINNVVAIGSANMTATQLSLLNRYTNNIKLLLDEDQAGEKGRARIHKKFDEYIKIKDAKLPAGYKDLDEYLMDNDKLNI